jgi:hypothetical protein
MRSIIDHHHMVKLSSLVHCLVVQTASSTMAPAIHVVSRYLPGEGLLKSADNDAKGGPVLNAADARNDYMDKFNHPRIRRALILQSMNDHADAKFTFEAPSAPSKNLDDYKLVCSDRLLEFFSTAYDRWHAMGEHGQDPCSTRTLEEELDDISHPLIPGNVLLPREPFQRPSKNVMGQIGYYCTDTVTPVFKELKEELLWDSAVVKQAIERLKDPKSNNMVYALGTHPGHHAAFDSFGGYCYINVSQVKPSKAKAENISTASSTCFVVHLFSQFTSPYHLFLFSTRLLQLDSCNRQVMSRLQCWMWTM